MAVSTHPGEATVSAPAPSPASGPNRCRQPSLARRTWAARWSYLYVGPMMVLLLAFVVYPIGASLGYTLYQWNGIGDPSTFVGLDNFVLVMGDHIFWGAVRHTFVYVAIVTPVQLVLALALALVLNNRRLRFATFYRTLFFLPVVTSAAVIGVVFQLLFSNFGATINNGLTGLGLTHAPIDWLGDPTFAMGIIIAVGIWHTLGYNLIYFLAGLQTIPKELYEAARLDGAGRIAQFCYITIPMLRSVGVVILLLAVIGGFQVFDLVQVLTNGGPFFATEVVNTYIYHLAFGGFGSSAVQPNVGLASAASFFYGLLLIGFSVVQVLVIRSLARRRAGQ
ncbi:carbohydrate ABC transporter permease [Actinopolymorpha pittospori]|uniref:Multiple sugar transport system permease protein n=1 Tax=Actinopolymorpha pittospori TaxID=648752 RepID=A0A927N627_9ACTN|nr:sugar ABC transporter permease [Actinopolymorpha pittospori]MBE1613106.1 multiple sugar transport system permease protein [Actinopolymorpha pittospori]